MKIRCDRCDKEVERREAFARVLDEDVYYFCSVECYEDPDYLPSLEEPDQDRQAPAGNA